MNKKNIYLLIGYSTLLVILAISSYFAISYVTKWNFYTGIIITIIYIIAIFYLLWHVYKASYDIFFEKKQKREYVLGEYDLNEKNANLNHLKSYFEYNKYKSIKVEETNLKGDLYTKKNRTSILVTTSENIKDKDYFNNDVTNCLKNEASSLDGLIVIVYIPNKLDKITSSLHLLNNPYNISSLKIYVVVSNKMDKLYIGLHKSCLDNNYVESCLQLLKEIYSIEG